MEVFVEAGVLGAVSSVPCDGATLWASPTSLLRFAINGCTSGSWCAVEAIDSLEDSSTAVVRIRGCSSLRYECMIDSGTAAALQLSGEGRYRLRVRALADHQLKSAKIVDRVWYRAIFEGWRASGAWQEGSPSLLHQIAGGVFLGWPKLRVPQWCVPPVMHLAPTDASGTELVQIRPPDSVDATDRGHWRLVAAGTSGVDTLQGFDASAPAQIAKSGSSVEAHSGAAIASPDATSAGLALLREWWSRSAAAAPGMEQQAASLIAGPIALAWGLLQPLSGTAASVSVVGASSGALLVGGVGTGKSHLLSSIVAALPAAVARHVRILRLASADILSGRAGESEERLQRLLDHALWADAPAPETVASAAGASPRYSLVVIDDAETLLPAAAAPSAAAAGAAASNPPSPLVRRLASMLLRAVCGAGAIAAATGARVCWLASASRIASLHPGCLVPSCFGGATVRLGALDVGCRYRVLRHLLRRQLPNRSSGVSEAGSVAGARDDSILQQLADVAERCHGMTVSDLVHLVTMTARLAIDGSAADFKLGSSSESAGSALEPVSSTAIGSAPPASSATSDLLFRRLHVALASARAAMLSSRGTMGALPPPASEAGLQRLVGMDDAVAAACAAIENALRPERRAACVAAGRFPPKGMLIEGSPGSGKTALAQGLARMVLDRGLGTALVVSATDLVSPVLGATEAALARLFAEATALAPCVLLLDRFDALASAAAGERASSSASSPFARLVIALGAHLDALEWSASGAGSDEGGSGADSAAGDGAGAHDAGHSMHSAAEVLQAMAQPQLPKLDADSAGGASADARGSVAGTSLDAPQLSFAAACAAALHLNEVGHAAPRSLASGGHAVKPTAPTGTPVFILAVAGRAEDVAAPLLRRGRIDIRIRTPALDEAAASALLRHFAARSPCAAVSMELAQTELARLTDRCTCGTTPPALRGATTASTSTATFASAPAEASDSSHGAAADSAGPAWYAFLDGLARHLIRCGPAAFCICGCRGSASAAAAAGLPQPAVPVLWSAARLEKLWQAAAYAALRRCTAPPLPVTGGHTVAGDRSGDDDAPPASTSSAAGSTTRAALTDAASVLACGDVTKRSGAELALLPADFVSALVHREA